MIAARRIAPVRAARLAGVAAVYLVACRVMLAPLCNFGALGSSTFEGDARLVVWALAWDNNFLLSGPRTIASLFDANIFYPARGALAYGEHFFGISLFSLPVYAATGNPVLGYNVVWLLSYFLSACAAHYVAWRLTRDHLASVVAGLAFAFCFFRMHHGPGHLHLLWAFWIPLSFVAAERWVSVRSWPSLALFVAILVLQALASWYQAVLIFVADALLVAWLVIVEPILDGDWRSKWPDMRRLVMQALVGALVALACVWPFARHYQSLPSGGPAELAAASADVAAFLVPPENTVLGQWLIHGGVKGPRWIWGELTLYLGWATIALAGAGAVIAIRGRTPAARRMRVFVALAMVAVALALGPSASEVADNAWHWSAFGVLARIPRAALFRAPARFSLLLTLALALLAAATSAALHARWGRLGRLVTLALLPVILLESYVVAFPGGGPLPYPVPPVYRMIATLPPGPVVSVPDYAATPAWYKEADYQYFSTMHWRPIANGYSRAAPDGFVERMERMKGFPDTASIAAIHEAGIRYVIVHAAHIADGAGAMQRAQADRGLRLMARFEQDYLFRVED